jgi:aspartate aminotransferase-like enzyme/N-acyl-L-homoserine lactone synthetase
MLQVGQYVFKRAETSQEFEQIHRLNHRTFVGEIPQHPDPGDGILIDKFHNKNAYLIVLRENQVVGMVSAHDQPPFSVAERLREPGILQRQGTRPLEVRLLAIDPKERNSTMFFGLIWSLYEYARSHGYTHLFISGVEERLALYQRLGFVALGPAVASGQASFVPMVLTIGQLPLKMQRVKQLWEIHMDKVKPRRPEPVCLLPGPVTTAKEVRDAFQQAPIYHRGPEFIRRFMKVREVLGRIVGGRNVALLNGSGTLGNETVAATLAADQQAHGRKGRGLMLINGEFGERLARQATRFGLEPRILSWPWGEPWDLDEVEAALAHEPAGSWVWGVHQDSSTGVLNDLPGLVKLARDRDIRVCVDCISSLGAVPLDLRDVYLATGATGKSLGAIAGTAIIFADLEAMKRVDRSRVPSYFDIAAAMQSEGPCYTFPSPTLLALEAALQEYTTPEKAQASYDRYQEMGSAVREHLRRLGLPPLAREDCACPVVTTFAPPGEESSEAFVRRCRGWGFAIGGESAYLARRRLVQIATMGAITRDMFVSLFDHLETWLAHSPMLAETV